MASSTRNAVEKATWSQMAERWAAYAQYYEDQLSVRVATRRRKANWRQRTAPVTPLAH
jgi:hypothetical protein